MSLIKTRHLTITKCPWFWENKKQPKKKKKNKFKWDTKMQDA